MPEKKKTKHSFAEQFSELEKITEWFEGDEVDLEEGIAKFERGMTLARELKKRLDDAEVKIIKLREQFDDES